jgi:2,5-diketo-D-gluconate reductase B
MTARILPSLGFGTAGFDSSTEARTCVREALSIGYRHIDTAQQYQYSAAVGDAIRESDVSRERLSIATKLHSEDLAYNPVISETETMLNRLGLDYINILYVHWPAHSYDPDRTFAAMERLCKQGLVNHIGVCNFTTDLLQEAVEKTTEPIFVNQIELHPFLPQEDIINFCFEKGIQIVAHSPLAGGLVFESATLHTIAERYHATVPQITLAWLLNKGDVSPIPKATGPHIGENYDAKYVDLRAEDVSAIDSIDQRHRVVDYAFAPWN